MRKTKRFFTGWRGAVALVGFLALIALLLAGCGGEPAAAPTEPPEPTEIAVVAETPTSAPTEPPMPTDTPTEPPPTEPPATDTPVPTDTPTPEPIDDTGCITCHTDQETLKALAKEPEETESLSEGEG